MMFRTRVAKFAFLIAAASGLGCRIPWTITPECWLIPDGYVGWLRLDFDVAGAPELPMVDGCRMVYVTPPGRMRTSSSDKEVGQRRNRYYYVTEKGRVPLREVLHGSMADNQIWDDVYVGHGRSLKSLYHCLFVGSQSEYRGQTIGCEAHFASQ